jgi:SSS family solute:Na+ symporter
MFGSNPSVLPAGAAIPHALALFQGAPSLAHLTTLDLAIIAIYFVMVIWIGFYLKSKANTSEEFFMAGREMTAWIAGLSLSPRTLGHWSFWDGLSRHTSTGSWPPTGTGWAPFPPCSFSAW